MTKQFNITIQNKPGQIAMIAELLGRNSINIKGISMGLWNKKGIVHLITDDENTTRHALSAEGLEFEEKEVLEITLPDRPGELAKMTRLLAKAGVNIESIFMLGGSSVTIAIGVEDMEKAREALWKYIS